MFSPPRSFDCSYNDHYSHSLTSQIYLQITQAASLDGPAEPHKCALMRLGSPPATNHPLRQSWGFL